MSILDRIRRRRAPSEIVWITPEPALFGRQYVSSGGRTSATLIAAPDGPGFWIALRTLEGGRNDLSLAQAKSVRWALDQAISDAETAATSGAQSEPTQRHIQNSLEAPDA